MHFVRNIFIILYTLINRYLRVSSKLCFNILFLLCRFFYIYVYALITRIIFLNIYEILRIYCGLWLEQRAVWQVQLRNICDSGTMCHVSAVLKISLHKNTAALLIILFKRIFYQYQLNHSKIIELNNWFYFEKLEYLYGRINVSVIPSVHYLYSHETWYVPLLGTISPKGWRP